MDETKKRKVYESQKRARNKYQREKCKVLSIRFYPSDMYIFDAFKPVDGKAKLIKEFLKEKLNLK